MPAPPVTPDPTGPGQESVWSYPRPPRLEPAGAVLRVVFGGETIAETTRGLRLLETSHPPTYYFPPESVRPGVLRAGAGGSFCEWKGRAEILDVLAGGREAAGAAWRYPDPTAAYAALAGYVAFYAGPMDACWVGDEQATPQPGGFYGGWVTRAVVGPFKGGPGSWGW